jgi:hypothetical protein
MGHTAAGYVWPMATGLQRMCRKLDCRAEVLRYGLNLLNRSTGAKQCLKELLRPWLIHRLRGMDAVIVVQHLRDAFRKSLEIERLRQALPNIPILLYDLVYLPVIGRWGPWMEQDWQQSTAGMERYDGYLCVSDRSRYPLSSEIPPCIRIGIDLDDGSLFPEQKGRFQALLDFKREAYPEERNIQLQALEETGTPFIELSGHYPIADIRRIYRQCSIYFPAHMESFGLPICELQACGSYIFTPYAWWCEAHWIQNGHTDAGAEVLTDNFRVYKNDLAVLKKQIEQIKDLYDACKVVRTLHERQPYMYVGDLETLQKCLQSLQTGEINAKSHQAYQGLVKHIPIRREY